MWCVHGVHCSIVQAQKLGSPCGMKRNKIARKISFGVRWLYIYFFNQYTHSETAQWNETLCENQFVGIVFEMKCREREQLNKDP